MTTTESIADARGVLDAFDRALAREVHNLSRWPELTWEQLHNRLQWEEKPVTSLIALERARRSSADARPWLRLKTRMYESDALVATLVGSEDTWGRGSELGYSCEFSPDGALLASADRTLRVWEVGTWVSRDAKSANYLWITGCVFTPDGALLVIVDGPTLRLLDADSLQERDMFEANDPIMALAVSPDARFLACGGDVEGMLRVWDRRTNEVTVLHRDRLRADRAHDLTINACAFSPDGSSLASASSDGTVRLWDVRTAGHVKVFDHGDRVLSCSFSPNGTFLAAGDFHAATIRSLATDETTLLPATRGLVGACTFSPDGELLAWGDGPALKLWAVRSAKDEASLEGHTHRVVGCAFSPDGGLLASASVDGSVRLWDLSRIHAGRRRSIKSDRNAPAELLRSWGADRVQHDVVRDADETRLPINSRASSPSGMLLGWGDVFGLLWLLDVSSGEKVPLLPYHEGEVTTCAFSPDGSHFASAGGGTILLREIATGRTRELKGHDGRVSRCAFTPDSSFLVSAGWDKTLRLWSVGEGSLLATLALPAPLIELALSPGEPAAVCADSIAAYLVELVGIAYGPLIVTGIQRGGRRTIRCPKCGGTHLLDERWLGKVIDCPTATCDLTLQVNPFVAGEADAHREGRR